MTDTEGPWTKKRLLGKGGNGEVWLARRTDKTAKDGSPHEVALKILNKSKNQPLMRFQHEVEALKTLGAHEGIIPLLEHWFPEDSSDGKAKAWFAMPVAMKLTANLPCEEIVKGIQFVATTLAHIHQRNYSHRDIKPENILCYRGKWVLADFGLVTYPEKPRLTDEGKKLGPIHFLAPEMLNDAANADGRKADVYSLAKTFWVLLTGQAFPIPGEQRAWNTAVRLENYLNHPRAYLLNDLLDRCTRMAAWERPSAEDVAKELEFWLQPAAQLTGTLQLPDRRFEFSATAAPMVERQKADERIEKLVKQVGRDLWASVEPMAKDAFDSLGLTPSQSGGTNHKLTESIDHTHGPILYQSSRGLWARTSAGGGVDLEIGTVVIYCRRGAKDVFLVGTSQSVRVIRPDLHTQGDWTNFDHVFYAKLETAEVEHSCASALVKFRETITQALDAYVNSVKEQAQKSMRASP